jgi:hypothetical protein
MALNVGELFGSLAWRHDKAGADEFDHRYDQAQAKARKKIEAQLGAAVDEKAFAKYHESLDRAERRAKSRDAFKATLGADFDPRAFNAYSRALDQAERDARKAHASTKSFSDEIQGLNVRMPQLGKTMGLLKWPALIAGAGMAAQAVSAATAGVTALGSALAPLSGALAAYPALGSAAAQGIGVWKLATNDVFKVVGGLNEQMDTQSKAFKKLSPEAQNFAKTLNDLKKPLTDLPAVAQKGLLPGLEAGIKAASRNLGVIRPIIRDTAKEIGNLASEAGKLVGSRAFGRDLQTQGERNVKWIGEGGTGALHLANALRNVTLAAGPLVDWMVRGAVQGTKLVDTFTAQARESGKLADFFHQTQVEMSRVVRIGADVATAFFNIARAGKPLGDDILVSIVRAADNFRKWTESARGQNSIAEYFRQARPAIFELGRLLHDITVDFLKLGQGNQVAPLIRTIRVDLLPRFVQLVDQTTKAFGPPMLEAIKQVAILFTTLGGTNGPLTNLVTLVGKIAGAINKATDAVPGLGSAISSLSTVASLYAALRIASTLSGLSRVIRLIKDARAASVGSAAVSAGAGAAEGAAAGAATRGGAVGTVTAIVSRFPVAAIAAAIVAAMGKPLLNVIRGGNPTGQTSGGAGDRVGNVQLAIARLNTQLARLNSLGDKGGAGKLADQFFRLTDATGKFKGSARDVDRLTAAAKDLADAGGTTQRTLGRDLDRAAAHFADFRRTGSNDLVGIKHATTDNMHFIARTLGEDSAAGKEALARNFRLARTAIRQAMQDGRISVKDGLAEIQRLMRAELKQYGITGGVASSIIKHGDIKAGGGAGAGHARGGWVAKARHAVGGWIGRRGMVSGDVVPIAPGALAAYGEYDAHGPGGERAILNRHQAPIAEMALAAGGYPGLDHLPPGRQLPVLERAMAPMGGLDRLFQAITRPHNFAVGGRFQGGGGIYSKQQLMQLWVQAGGPASVANIAAAIALAESGGNANARNSIGATGLWQIYNGPNTDPGLRDPMANARAAVAKYRAAHGFTPWTTYTGADTPGHEKTYLRFLGAGAVAGGPTTPVAPATATPITAPRTGLGGLLGAIVQATLDRGAVGATRHVQDLLDASGATAGPGGPGPAGGPSGIGTYEGIPMARWVIAALNYARSRGAGGHPTSGYRSPDQVISGPVVAPQGHSEHQGTQYPHGAVDFGGPFDPAARSVKMGVVNATSSFKWPLLAPAGFRDDGHASGTGHALGGFLRRFQSGGRLGAIAGRAVGKAASGIGTKLHIKSLASMQTDRNGRFDAIMGRVEDARADYQRWDARYNLTDEGELIDQTTGEPNVKAINQKLAELSNLAITRKFIEDQLEEARSVARQIVKTYNTIIRSLTRSLRHTKGKDRSGIRSRIKTYQTRLSEWQGKLKDVGGDVFEAHTDVIEIQGELADARAALGGSADIRQQYAQSLADAASQNASDAGGGVDTTTPDAAPAAPTAADIAAAAYQDVQAYLGQQRDLLTSFAGDAYTPRQAVGAGGVFSGHPDLQGAALGALRGFGGGANLAGSLGLGGSGPSVGVLNVNFQQPPDNAPTLISQLRFQVENGGVG